MGQSSSSYSRPRPRPAVSCSSHDVICSSSKWHWPDNADLSLCLPDECLSIVFGKLGCHDRNNCSLVCKRWKLVDSKSRQHLVLVARFEMSPSLPALLSRFTSVSFLSLKCSRKHISINDDALALIPTLLTSLKKLKLKGCVDITDNGLHAFSLHPPPLLTKLSFASCGFGSTGLISILINCPSLQDLTLKRLRKLDAQNTPLSLDLLEDKNCPYNNNHYTSIAGISMHKHNYNYKLERICLKDLHNARLFIPLLCSCDKTLKTLIVCRSSGNWDRVLETFQGRTTSISEIQMENVQMGDAGLVAISASCPDLQILYLSRPTDCTDDGLSAIANSCKKLRKLHIDAWSRFGSRTIGEEGVLSIASRCFHLQEMVLMGVPVTIASLNALASNCLALERMALCNSDSVGDTEMAFIAAKFFALKKLCIKNCPISDSGVEAIGGGCPSLVKLKVKRCRGVTQASVSKLRMQRSSLVVSVDAGSILFDGEGVVEAEDVLEDEGIRGRRNIQASSLPNTRSTNNTRSTRTHVICSSRGAHLLRSKFGRRRPDQEISHSTYSSSATSRTIR